MENPFELIMTRLSRIESMIQSLEEKIEDSNDRPEKKHELMNMNDAAEFLRMAKPTLYGYTFRRKIPHSKIGKKTYFKRDELLEWASEKRVKTIKEIEQEVNMLFLRNKRKNR